MLEDKSGTHVHHCCLRHGCKYGYSNQECPVSAGVRAQKYPCEYCDMDWQERGRPKCSADGCSKPGFWKWKAEKVNALAMVALREVEFYFCDGHDAWHRFDPECKFASKPVDRRIR